MNALDALFGTVQPQANQAATNAANAAVDSLAARPFNVVVTVDPTTRTWLTVLVIITLLGIAAERRL